MKDWPTEDIIKRFVLGAFVAAAVVCGGSKGPQQTPRRAPQGVTVTDADIARGWRLAETVEETHDYAMPPDAVIVGNWHKRGTFGEWLRYELGWGFPLGSNDETYAAFAVFNDAKIRPTPRDRSHEICAVGAPMLAMQGASRFWTCDGSQGEKTLTWENFFLNADTNAPVNAQIVLAPTGDFETWSNNIGRIYSRINPDDWDGDGLANEIDEAPCMSNGECFGTGEGWWAANAAAAAATNANPEAYYTLSFAATTDLTRIDITCDGASDLGNFVVIANAGQSCEVPLLKGANYAVRASAPLANISVSDENAEIYFYDYLAAKNAKSAKAAASNRNSADFGIYYPLEFSFEQNGSDYTLNVSPSIHGISLAALSGGCCSLSAATNGFAWVCSASCTCGGVAQSVEASATWAGYTRAFTCYIACACGHDSPEPEPQEAPYAASVSASFSTAAIIFEDAYENTPGAWVGRRSSASTLTIHANGGPNGGTLTTVAENIEKLQKNSGPAFPTSAVDVPAGHSVSYEMNYVGLEASDALDDIIVTATFEENDSTNAPLVSVAKLTAVRIEFTARHPAPAHADLHRHVFGVLEAVDYYSYPANASIDWLFLEDNEQINPFSPGYLIMPSTTNATSHGVCSTIVTSGNACFTNSFKFFLPQIEARNPRYNETISPVRGEAGWLLMHLDLYVLPSYVSFFGLDMQEIPDESRNCPHTGYYNDTAKGGALSHGVAEGAGLPFRVNYVGYWCSDQCGRATRYEKPWSDGWKEWPIPIGWGVGENIMAQFDVPPTTQRFSLQSNGTFSIRKFGFAASRDIRNNITISGHEGN